jgi:hypothetical protein
MYTKIWSQNLKRKISWQTRSHRRENCTAMDFEDMGFEYNPVDGL